MLTFLFWLFGIVQDIKNDKPLWVREIDLCLKDAISRRQRRMKLQYRWQIKGIRYDGEKQEICHKTEEWMESLQACQNEARLHYDSEIFYHYKDLEIIILTRPHPDIVNEEMKRLNRHTILKHELLICYAEELRKVIFEQLVKELCNGCSMDHPSQIQHDVCLMMDTSDQISLCLDLGLERLCQEKIIAKWVQRTKHVADPPLTGIDIIKYTYEDISEDKETLRLLIKTLSRY